MNTIGCPICGVGLRLSPARSRKAKNPKTFLMLVCPTDGRHFRGFISDRQFVGKALARLEEAAQ